MAGCAFRSLSIETGAPQLHMKRITTVFIPSEATNVVVLYIPLSVI